MKASILIVVTSVAAYQLAQHAIAQRTNPWFTLLVVYLVAAAISTIGWLVSRSHEQGGGPMRPLPVLVLGLAVVGVEFGYLSAYRNGARLATVGLLGSTGAAALLAVLGVWLFGERINLRTVCGLVACGTGLARGTECRALSRDGTR